MPGNLRRKLVKGVGPTEKQYERLRRQLMRETGICAICLNAVDPSLKPICSKVDTKGFTVENAHEIPLTCGPYCDHPRKANPFVASLDHIIPVDQLPPGSPLLVSRKNSRLVHHRCNQIRGAGEAAPVDRYVSSGDWF